MAFNAGSIEATLTLNRNPFTAGIKASRAEAKKFANENFEVKFKPVLDKGALASIKAQLSKIIADVTVRPKLDRTALQAVKAQIERTVGNITVRARLDNSTLTAIRERINRAVGTITVRANLDNASLVAIRERINAIVGKISVKLDLDSASVAALKAKVKALDLRARVRLDADGNNLGGITNIINVITNSFNNMGSQGNRAFRNVNSGARILLSTLPLILSVGGSSITGLIGLIGALGSVIATAGIGLGAFATVGASVFGAITKAADTSGAAAKRAAASMKSIENARRNLQRVTESAAESEATAARRVEDAEERLRRTVESAADAKAAAQRQVESATRSLERAQQSARDAQERLTQARRDAAEELEDLQLQLRGGALAEEQAVLDLEEAQLRLAEARKKGVSGNDLKQLELDVKRAALSVDETRERYGDLKEESDAFAKSGIEGSKGVRDAQRDVADANQSVSDAERDLALAREEASKAARDANRDIADAEKDLAQARADAAKAHRDAQRDIADAQRDLAEAQQAAADAEEKSAVRRTAAFLAAVAALKNLKAEYDALVQRTQDPVSNAFAANFNAAAALLKTLDPIIISTANALTTIGQKMEQYFGGPLWKQFVNFISQNVGPTLLKLFDIIAYGTQGVMNLVMAFNPLGQWLLDKLVKGMMDFANWTSKLGSDPEFQRFIDLAKESLPIIADLIWSIVKFLFNLAVALAPVGNAVAKVFTAIFNALSSMPPEMLAAIALALGGIVSALILGATGGTAALIGILIGLGAALKGLYDTSVPFRDMINRIWDDMKTRFGPVFEYLADLFKTTVGPAFERVQKIFEEKFLPSFERLYNFLAPIFEWLIRVVGEEVVAAFEGLLLVVENVIGLISGIIDTFIGLVTGDWGLFWDGLKTIAESVLGIILGIFGVSLDKFYSTISSWWESITTGWTGFWDGLGDYFSEWWNRTTEEWNTFWTNFGNTATQWWDTIKTGWTEFWNSIGAYFTQWWENTKREWNEFWTSFGQTLDTWINNVTTRWNTFWDGIKNFANQVWEAIKLIISAALDLINGNVSSAADKIGQAWRKIANLFRDPINWVIDVVVNKGVLDSWNTVMGWIGAESLKVGRLAPLPAFAQGGQIVGPGSGTSDSILARVSDGEYIMPAARAKRHMHFLEALRQGQPEAIQAAGGANDSRPYPRYAAGGTVQAGMDFARREHGKPYVWGGVGPRGYDCSGFMSAITNVLNGRGPHSRIGTTANAPWGGWARGLSSQFGVGYFKGNPGHMAGTLAGMNVESRGSGGTLAGSSARGATNGMFTGHMSLPQVAGQFVDGGGGGGMMASLWSIFGSKVEGLFQSLLNRAGFPGTGIIGDAMWQVPVKMIPKVVGALKDKLLNMFTSVGGGGGAGDPAVVEAVRGVARNFGWDMPPQWDAIYRLVQKESSWNPQAANPTSSARGLFQKMTSIHGPVEGSPAGQAQWGLNYIKGRYGTPVSALAFHDRNNYYDTGGMLMPGVAPINTSGQVERILSPQQTSDFEKLVAILEALVSEDGPLQNNSKVAPLIGSLAVTTTPRATAQDIIEEAIFQIKKAKRKGVHK